MKSLPIGKIVENDVDGEMIFSVNLFDNNIVKLFGSLKESLTFLKLHCFAILKIGEVNSLCVEYEHKDGRTHYLVVENEKILNEETGEYEDDAIVYEQTKFEYIKSHKIFYKRYRTRRIINERSYSYSDILRSAINWRRLTSFVILYIVASLMIIFGIYTLGAIDFLETEKGRGTEMPTNDIHKYMGFNVFIFAGAWLIGLTMLIVFFISHHTQVRAEHGDLEINWKVWYKRRVSFMIFTIFIVISWIILLGLFYQDLSKHGYISNANNREKYGTKNLYFYLIFITIVLAIVLIIQVAFLGITVFWTVKNLRKYFEKDERKDFYKWLFDINSKEPHKVDESIFLFNPDLSTYRSKEEIRKAAMLDAKLTSEEANILKRKSYEHLNRAIHIHLVNIGLKPKGEENDNFSQNY